MEIKDIKALIDAAKETNYTYIKIKNKDFMIELSKEEQCHHHGEMPMMMQPMTNNMVATPPVSSQKNEIGDTNKVAVEDPNIYVVTSPIVGTYYSASSPEVAPFVKIGDQVSVNQTLCIIEAMKLMNEIDSEVCGEVIEILVNNEAAVEYGQPLFKIRKA